MEVPEQLLLLVKVKSTLGGAFIIKEELLNGINLIFSPSTKLIFLLIIFFTEVLFATVETLVINMNIMKNDIMRK